MDVVIKMEIDHIIILLDLYTQERLHEAASSNIAILGVLPQKLVLELGTGYFVHHVAQTGHE